MATPDLEKQFRGTFLTESGVYTYKVSRALEQPGQGAVSWFRKWEASGRSDKDANNWPPIIQVDITRDGKGNNGPNGEAHHRRWNRDTGILVCEDFFKDGVRANGPDGVARREYDGQTGQLVSGIRQNTDGSFEPISREEIAEFNRKKSVAAQTVPPVSGTDPAI